MKTQSRSSAPKRATRSRPKSVSRPTKTAKPAAAGKATASKASASQKDKVTLSGDKDRPRAGFVNPLNNMFESSKSAGAHATGDLSKGSYDVGALAQTSSSRQATTQNGDTTHSESQSKEAHAKVNASGNLSEGTFSSELDLGASVKHDESQVTRKEAKVGGIDLAAEAGGEVHVDAQAGVHSRTDVDLAKGRLDHESGGALGVEASARAHAATEVEALGVTRRDEVGVGVEAKAKIEGDRKLKIDENGIDASQSASAEAKLAADATASTRYSSEAGSLEGQVRGEASAFAEAHASSQFKLSEDELSFRARAGASAAAQLQAEGTLQGETRNGSAFSVNGGANTGSVGAGAGYEFSRKKGQTTVGFESSGGLAIVGGHLNGKLTVADRDIAETAAAPLAVGGQTYNAIGNGAEALSHSTNGLRRDAHQRQDFIQEMGAVPTGNFLADTGIAAANQAHGAYTSTVDFADTFAQEAGHSYRQAGQNLNAAAARVADRVEQNVGQTLDYGVKKAHSGYQYGRAVGGGFIQGLGEGAYNLTSLGGLLY